MRYASFAEAIHVAIARDDTSLARSALSRSADLPGHPVCVECMSIYILLLNERVRNEVLPSPRCYSPIRPSDATVRRHPHRRIIPAGILPNAGFKIARARRGQLLRTSSVIAAALTRSFA